MEIRQLRYFLEIARSEHLTQSARALFVTQSTVSHSLRQLEDELGVRLFDRVGRGLRLSQAGALFRAYAGRALQEIDAGRMALTELSGLQSGTLTVGAIATFLNALLPPAVAAFSGSYPRVRVVVRDLRAGAIEELLAGGELDVGIAFHPARRDDVESEPLFDERMLFVASRTHPLAKRRSVALKALAGVPLALQPRSYATRQLIDAAFRAAGVEATVPVEMESIESLIAACRRGGLASIVPERAALHASGVLTHSAGGAAGAAGRGAVAPGRIAQRRRQGVREPAQVGPRLGSGKRRFTGPRACCSPDVFRLSGESRRPSCADPRSARGA
jgi:LysR family cyn operon transcriptional activator